MDISELEKSEIVSEINYLKRKTKLLEQMLIPDQRSPATSTLVVEAKNIGSQFNNVDVQNMTTTVNLSLKKRSIC